MMIPTTYQIIRNIKSSNDGFDALPCRSRRAKGIVEKFPKHNIHVCNSGFSDNVTHDDSSHGNEISGTIKYHALGITQAKIPHIFHFVQDYMMIGVKSE